jgi:spermidine/putrescine-binding protein
MIKLIKEGSRVTDSKEWFDMWFEDKKSIIATMYSNMGSDLAAGYDYFGKSIQRQKQEIANYEDEFERQLDKFKSMSDDEVNRWCFYDMKKRGAIE